MADLVAQTVYWFPSDVFVPVLGIWEMAVGLGLLFAFALRLTLLLFWLQMAGTFLVLVVRPEVAFQGRDPKLLEGIAKIVPALQQGSSDHQGLDAGSGGRLHPG